MTRNTIVTARTTIRVRYAECDPMGVAHHTAYPVWFEIGRTELLRERGYDYRDFEAQGTFLAVVSLEVRCRRPARYDDLLSLETTLINPGASRVKVEHAYQLFRGDELLTTASTVLACLGRDGRARPLPEPLAHPSGM
jgi:acyl-CoA thioester hydrolase